jgi:hypothetical protein
MELPQESARRCLWVRVDELRRRQLLKWLECGRCKECDCQNHWKGRNHRSGIFSCSLGIRHEDEGRMLLQNGGVNLRIYTISKSVRLSYEMLCVCLFGCWVKCPDVEFSIVRCFIVKLHVCQILRSASYHIARKGGLVIRLFFRMFSSEFWGTRRLSRKFSLCTRTSFIGTQHYREHYQLR